MGDPISAELERLLAENAELRRRLSELQESERVLRASFEHSPVAQALVDRRDGRYVEVNQAFLNLTGLTRAVIVGKTSSELGLLASPAQRPQLIDEARQRGGAPDSVFDVVRADGQRRSVLASLRPAPIGDESILSLTLEDQTDQARTHAALNASEAQALALLNALPDLLFEIDADGRIHDYRGSLDRLYVSPETFLGKTVDQILPAHARQAVNAGIAETVATGLHRGASYFLDVSGTRRWFEVSMAAKDAARSRLIALVRDITERKQAQERVRTMLSALPDLLLVLSRDGTYLELHTPSLELLPTTPEQLLGNCVRRHLPPVIAEACLRQIDATLTTGQMQVAEYELMFGPNDRRRYEVRTVPREDETVLALVRDISERMRAAKEKAALEEQLRHAQKMEAIGTLAGGVAHDFNNILGGLLGNLSLLERMLGGEGELEQIHEMKELVQRGADLSKQLLGFSRRGKYNVQPLDLARVVQKASAMFGRTRPDLMIRCQFAPGLHAVLMDYTQLEQVLLNLFVNAGQAMPDGGLLSVRAENTTLSESQTLSLGARPGQFVKLAVSDTGCGMDVATMARIFEPFFTTKAAGQGTGLGLASVYGIVRNHGGLIEVQSEPDKGACFTLFLPSSPLAVEANALPQAVGQPGRGTLLFVDDEPSIRKVFSLLLSSYGYKVLLAESGQDAIRQVKAHRDVLQIVVLDLTMPGLSGAKTFEILRELAPELKVLLVSGHAEERQARDLLAKGAQGFLQKPFDGATLVQKLSTIL